MVIDLNLAISNSEADAGVSHKIPHFLMVNLIYKTIQGSFQFNFDYWYLSNFRGVDKNVNSHRLNV